MSAVMKPSLIVTGVLLFVVGLAVGIFTFGYSDIAIDSEYGFLIFMLSGLCAIVGLGMLAIGLAGENA